jgi:hypothetical protein
MPETKAPKQSFIAVHFLGSAWPVSPVDDARWGRTRHWSQVGSGLGHQGDESRDDVQDALMSRAQDAQERLKFIGSNMTSVVPSQYGVLSS